MSWTRLLPVLAALLISAVPALAEDGYDLWLRYTPVERGAQRDAYRAAVQRQVVVGESDVTAVIRDELARALPGLLAQTPEEAQAPGDGGTLIVARLDDLADLGIDLDDADTLADRLGRDGYVIRTLGAGDAANTLVTAAEESGLLYGVFGLLRRMQMRQDLAALDIIDVPRIEHRVLQHWDNLDGSTERVYSEDPRSIWWDKDTDQPVPVDRWQDYGRACASIGINVAVLNNVNATTATLLPPALGQVQRIADVLRPYGVRVALSVNFASPLSPEHEFRGGPGIGSFDTADPTDPRVVGWWAEKVEEIYGLVPDFAGFLVKAGSEGMPGPERSGAKAATGANMLGEVLRPHGGIVMWRTFTWDDVDPDLTKRQYIRFAPQDDAFQRQNVFLQSKFGPRDFMPREPFHPLFGAMTHTQLSVELQITQEYTGHDKYLMYWATLWQEILQSDTYAKGEGSEVWRVIDGSLHGYDSSQIAGVANVSRVRNWTGHHFAQANWYAFGRFAWDPGADARDVGEEWVRMTWGNHPQVVRRLVDILMDSHETMASYVGPLGIGHTNTRQWEHYEPTPHHDDYWQRQYINPTKTGIGRDRTAATGSGATAQYQPPVAAMYEDRQTCPENILLWFHHVGWNERLSSGRTVWQTLVQKYNHGVTRVGQYEQTWRAVRPHIDADRHAHVLDRLQTQHAHARKFRERWLSHFSEINGLPAPNLR